MSRAPFDATGGGLVIADGSSRWLVGAIVPPEAAQSYAEHYSRIDHVLAAVEEGPVGAVRAGGELIAAKPTTEFHADWIRPYGLEDGLFVRLNSGTTTSCFVVASPRRSESFATPERVKLMSGLVPHLRQALRTQDKLATSAQGTTRLLRRGRGGPPWRRHRRVGMLGRPSQHRSRTNRSGRRRHRDSVRTHRATGSTQAERRLNGALHAALNEDAPMFATVDRSSAKDPPANGPTSIHVLPLHRSTCDETLNDATALVLVIDPEHENLPAPALLRQLYNFTNTEAEIALRLTRGDDLKQISDELSVSPSTVRTHLQHLFVKTDTHRQAELIRHLLAISP